MKGHKTGLKLVVFSEEDMSLEGYRQWSSFRRASLRKIVYKYEMNLSEYFEERCVPVALINTKRKIMTLIQRFCGKGVWILRGYSGAKTSKRVKMIRLAKVIVREHGDGYQSRIMDTWRLERRYWFWSGRDKSLLAISFLLLMFLPSVISLLILNLVNDSGVYVGWIARHLLRILVITNL
ncbi:MAG: hypothetical protein AABY22_00445 [Nanoarchaeota archaeon]